MKLCNVVLSGLLALLPLSASPAQTITLGQVDLSFYAVTGGIVQEVLERSGQPFVLTEGSHADIYP